jgi:hypothetical protein
MYRTFTTITTSFICALALIVIGGCAAKELASKEEDAQAKEFVAPANKSNIYIVRKGGIRGQAIHMSIALDREVVAAIQNDTYVLLQVNPGKHRLEIGNSLKKTLPNVDFLHPVNINLETLPGRSYFVAGNMTMGRPNVSVLPESEGRILLSKAKFRRVPTLK